MLCNNFMYMQNLYIFLNNMCVGNKVATITVRVPEEIRREMKKFRHINWSEVIRQAIAEELKREKMRRASQTIDKLRAKSKVKWDSVAVIREWREKRR